MDLVKLKYFYVVAKYQHVTKAAEELHISQPSLTQSIHLLENDLGVKLFAKQGRRIVLTEYGKFLQDRLNTILPEFENLKNEINFIKNKKNKTVKLNILAASSFVVEKIIEFRNKFPEAVFDFEQSSLKNDCDIVIATNGVNTQKLSNLVAKTIKEEQIFLAVPKNSKYSTLTEIELSDLKDENFIMFSSSRLFGVICNNFCLQAGFSPKILFESDSPSAVQDIIGIGAGVAFWPEISWGKVDNKNIVKVPIKSPQCKRDLIIELHNVYTNLNKSIYAEEFYKFLTTSLIF